MNNSRVADPDPDRIPVLTFHLEKSSKISFLNFTFFLHEKKTASCIKKFRKFNDDSKYFCVKMLFSDKASESQNPDPDPNILEMLGRIRPYIRNYNPRNAVPLDWI